MPGKFVVQETKSGMFWFKLVAGNGVIVATSAGHYRTAKAAMKGIELVRKYAPVATIEDLT